MYLKNQLTEAYEQSMKLPKMDRWFPESIAVLGAHGDQEFLICEEDGEGATFVRNDSAAWSLIMYCAYRWIQTRNGGDAQPVDARNAQCGSFWAQPIEFLTIETRRAVGA